MTLASREQLLRYIKIVGLITGLDEEQYLDLQACLGTHLKLSDFQFWFKNSVMSSK